MVKFSVRKGKYTFLFMANKVAKSIHRPTSSLAGSLAEFELFILLFIILG